MIRASVLLLALVTALPAAAQIYSWRDKDGKMHYSDTPPPSGAVKTLSTPAPRPAPALPEAEGGSEDAPAAGAPAPTAPAAAKPKTLAERELEFRQRRAAEAEAQAKADKERAENTERQAACEQARNQLTALTSGQRMARFNSAGEKEMFDDAARQREIERTRQHIDANCR